MTKQQKKEWKDLSKGEKIAAVVIIVVIVFFIGSFFSSDAPEQTEQNSKTTATEVSNPKKDEPVTMSPQEKMLESITGLMDSGQAFDTGSYVQGNIPKGEYAFVSFEGSGKYYSEEDSAGNIIDNENFDSFGYVYVHAAGNIETQGVLIKIGALKQLEVKGAKEIYEKLNNVNDYKGSAWYKVGSDIKPGQHTIQSLGEAYVAVMSGPVGNNDIVDNNIFNGKYSVNVQKGQYLQVSGGEIK